MNDPSDSLTAAIVGLMLLLMGAFAMEAHWQLASRVSLLEDEIAIKEQEIALISDRLDRISEALTAHQEYINAKQRGFASAWHYARHEGWEAVGE